MELKLQRDKLFLALTRPQMLAGVTYTFFVIIGIVAVELFLIFQAWWVLLVAAFAHGLGMLACLHEPRIFDLWVTRVRNCPRIKNYGLWKCNCYRPGRAIPKPSPTRRRRAIHLPSLSDASDRWTGLNCARSQAPARSSSN